jgi:hypothetical protein
LRGRSSGGKRANQKTHWSQQKRLHDSSRVAASGARNG